MEKKVFVFDLEQFPNFHSGTFINRDDRDDKRVFVIHEAYNDYIEYFHFLQDEVAGLIGFNSVNYDYPLLHFFLELMPIYADRKTEIGASRMNEMLHLQSQQIIRAEYSAIPEWQTKIPQLDLFRIHHFDNKAKRTSLKAVEIAINSPNVQDIPFDEDHYVTEDEIPLVLDYNYNDTIETFRFYELSKDLVELRKQLSARYNINLRNANDPKIGQEIFGREIAKKKEIPYKHLRDMRTYRKSIALGKCLLPIIEFQNKEFKTLHQFFKDTVITTTYKAFQESVIYKGFKYDYGAGGIHGCIESGVYESDKDNMIVDIDVAAYYPSLGIVNGFYPQHLGPTFTEVYKELFDTRMEAKRTGDKVTNSGLKLALNGVFGKSNDLYSLFYDPRYTMQITINGQLLLSMLAERIVDAIPDVIMLQTNTDGMTIKIPRQHLSFLHNICQKWEEDTGMILEFGEYKKMVIRDVNNYLAQTVDGYAKPKGVFEIIPTQNGAIAYNKNWSMRVVPKAIHAHYLEGTPIDEFIHNHDNIYDFCIGFRARKDWGIYYTDIQDDRRNKVRQQKTVRYYMSRSGGALTKENLFDKRVISLEAGKSATVFNRFVNRIDWDDYDINYGYYIAQANKIKYAVNDGQLKLL